VDSGSEASTTNLTPEQRDADARAGGDFLAAPDVRRASGAGGVDAGAPAYLEVEHRVVVTIQDARSSKAATTTRT
jgi:hypothetical protein